MIGGTVLVVGGTIALIIDEVSKHYQAMQRIENLREETGRKLENQPEKELYKHKEFQEVLKLFQFEVEQAKKLMTEDETQIEMARRSKAIMVRPFLVNMIFDHFI